MFTVDLTGATLLLVLATIFLAVITSLVALGGIWSAAELQAARKLDWAPYLTFGGPSEEPHGQYLHYVATVKNIGRGPAINCIVTRRSTAEVWHQSATFDLGGGDKDRATAPQQEGGMPDFLTKLGNGRTVLLCTDQFGRCHMFDLPRARQVSRWWLRQDWAKWYRSQIKAVG
jgi:hypothetical protein